MQHTDILEKVTTILVEQLGLERDHITAEAEFERDLGADSLDCVELVMAVEEEFCIDITDDEADGLKTVKQAVDFIQSQI